MVDFRTVKLSKGLVDAIEDFVDQHPRYRTVADFVNTAARNRLENLEKTDLLRRQVEKEAPA